REAPLEGEAALVVDAELAVSLRLLDDDQVAVPVVDEARHEVVGRLRVRAQALGDRVADGVEARGAVREPAVASGAVVVAVRPELEHAEARAVVEGAGLVRRLLPFRQRDGRLALRYHLAQAPELGLVHVALRV